MPAAAQKSESQWPKDSSWYRTVYPLAGYGECKVPIPDYPRSEGCSNVAELFLKWGCEYFDCKWFGHLCEHAVIRLRVSLSALTALTSAGQDYLVRRLWKVDGAQPKQWQRIAPLRHRLESWGFVAWKTSSFGGLRLVSKGFFLTQFVLDRQHW